MALCYPDWGGGRKRGRQERRRGKRRGRDRGSQGNSTGGSYEEDLAFVSQETLAFVSNIS